MKLARVLKRICKGSKTACFYLDIPIIALSTTITRNILEYICEYLHLRMPVDLYKQTLDRLNITYMVKRIKQKGFKELDVLVLQTGKISDIPRTMIFVDKIGDRIKMTQYLRSLLPESLRKKRDQIFQIFSSNQ